MEENPNAFQSLLRCFPDTKVPSHVSVILRFPNPKSKHGEIIQTRDLGLTQAMILMRIKLSVPLRLMNIWSCLVSSSCNSHNQAC